MANRHFSDEDLRALLGYIASNPAILFPTLTRKERESLIQDVLDQYDEMHNMEFESHKDNPALVVKSTKLEGGRWVTVNHNHVYVKGEKVIAGNTHIVDRDSKQDKQLKSAKNLAKETDSYTDWAIGMNNDHPEVHQAVKDHMAETGKKYKDLYHDWGGGSNVQEWKPDSTKQVDDVNVGAPKFQPSEVNVKLRKDGRTALASAPSGSTIQVHQDLLNMDKDSQRYVIAHEVGHLISNAHPEVERHILENPQGALGRFNQKRMFFDGVSHTPEESWADAFSYYHTEPEFLKDKHPKAYDFVDKMMKKLPKAKEYLDHAFAALDKMKSKGIDKAMVNNDHKRGKFGLKSPYVNLFIGDGKQPK